MSESDTETSGSSTSESEGSDVETISAPLLLENKVASMLGSAFGHDWKNIVANARLVIQPEGSLLVVNVAAGDESSIGDNDGIEIDDADGLITPKTSYDDLPGNVTGAVDTLEAYFALGIHRQVVNESNVLSYWRDLSEKGVSLMRLNAAVRGSNRVVATAFTPNGPHYLVSADQRPRSFILKQGSVNYQVSEELRLPWAAGSLQKVGLVGRRKISETGDWFMNTSEGAAFVNTACETEQQVLVTGSTGEDIEGSLSVAPTASPTSVVLNGRLWRLLKLREQMRSNDMVRTQGLP